MVHRGLCDSQIRNLHSACVHGVVLALPLCRCVATTVYSPGHGYFAARHSACLCGHASVCVVLSVRSRACERVLRIVDVMGLHLSRSVVQIKLSPSRSGYKRHGTCSTTESLRGALGLGYMRTRSCNTDLYSLLKPHNLRAQVNLRLRPK